MDEKLYLLVSNLTSARLAYKAIAQLLPNMNPCVPREELSEVLKMMQGWIDAMYKALPPLEGGK